MVDGGMPINHCTASCCRHTFVSSGAENAHDCTTSASISDGTTAPEREAAENGVFSIFELVVHWYTPLATSEPLFHARSDTHDKEPTLTFYACARKAVETALGKAPVRGTPLVHNDCYFFDNAPAANKRRRTQPRQTPPADSTVQYHHGHKRCDRPSGHLLPAASSGKGGLRAKRLLR